MHKAQEDTYEWVAQFQKAYEDMYGYYVYMHVSPDGKKYVGYGHGEPETRWRNGTGYNHNQRFTDAIKKYGWNHFQHIMLQSGLSLQQARILERELILAECSTDPEIGYNVQVPLVPEEDIWRVYQLIFPDGKMYVGRTGKSFKRRWRNGDGYKSNKEMYAAIQAVGWENVKKIRCCEGLPEESAAAMEQLLIEVNRTTDPSRGYNKTKGGMKEVGNHLSAEVVEKRIRTKKLRPPTAGELKNVENLKKSAKERRIRVKVLETGQVYSSITEAARALGVAKCSLSHYLLYKTDKTIRGVHVCKAL